MDKIKNFTKADLKPGMIIETRNNKLFMVYGLNGKLILANENESWSDLSSFKDNLLLSDKEQTSLDIIRVRKPFSPAHFMVKQWHNVPIIWDREDKLELTFDLYANGEYSITPQEPTCSKMEQVQTAKQVDFNRDIVPLLLVMIEAYEKANIHAPYRDEEEASEILSSEAEEACEALEVIDRLIFDEDYNFNILEQVDLKVIEAHAISAICELLQVIAVCKKYGQLLAREDGNR